MSQMRLTKRVPAKTLVMKADWCHREWMPMSEKFRAIRAKMTNRMDKCFCCQHPFANEEMMALACFESKGNKTLCQKCATELVSSAADNGYDE